MKLYVNKQFSIFILSLIYASLFAQQSSFAPFNADMLEFHRLAEQWRLSHNSKDAQNLAPLYAEEAEYISAHVPGLAAKGRNALLSYFQNGMDLGGHLDVIEVLSINLSCELATLLCKYEATNAGQKAVGRNLLVLKRIGKNWLILTHITVV